LICKGTGKDIMYNLHLVLFIYEISLKFIKQKIYKKRRLSCAQI
jgi:hypothetical protein